MDGCSLQDAFPDSVVSADCYNRGAVEESRRQEKKKSRRCRDPSIQTLSPEPDRPAAQRMEPVLPMNAATGLTEHSPATAQYPYEPFVGQSGDMADLPLIQQNVKSMDDSQMGSLPAYFGASPNDSVSPVLQTPPTQRPKKTEGFVSDPAPFVNVIGEDAGYRLYPDFATSFSLSGAQKAGSLGTYKGPSTTYSESNYLTPTAMTPSSVLPYPNTDIFWKTPNVTGGQSSFFQALKAPGGMPTGPSYEAEKEQPTESGTRREVMDKLDRIFARLQDLETTKAENANTEVLMFVMTGIGIIFLMDISTRLAMRR